MPAGRIEGQNSELTVQQELREEIGAICGEISYISMFYVSNGVSNECCKVYLAQNVELQAESQPELSELLYRVTVPYSKAIELVHSGEMTDGPSALALLLCEAYV